jgi:SAM-dependent MidA family methyltransferase
MESALYDDDAGFYTTTGRAGRRADFITSPEVGPLFGAVVARLLDAHWVELGRPERFAVVEGGAGPGTLARSVLAAAPACGPALRYVAVERSATQRAGHPAGVESVGWWPGTAVGPGVVIANELLDNLPFDLLQGRLDGWDEVRVGCSGGRLVEVVVPCDEPPAWVPPPRPGARLPVQSAAAAWVETARRTLTAGAVVVIDYAARARDLVALAPSAWLRTYRAHGAGEAWLDSPGTADITAPVVVEALPAADTAATQAEVLRAHGIDDLVAEGRAAWAERAAVGDLAALRARSRVREAEALLDPAGLGGFTVLQWDVHRNRSATS